MATTRPLHGGAHNTPPAAATPPTATQRRILAVLAAHPAARIRCASSGGYCLDDGTRWVARYHYHPRGTTVDSLHRAGWILSIRDGLGRSYYAITLAGRDVLASREEGQAHQ